MEDETKDNQTTPGGAVAASPRTGFPQLRLSAAAKYVKRAAQQGRRHSPSTMADYMGHSTPSGGAFRMKMAALRSFGLITGAGDQLTIADDGMLLANADDEGQEQEVLARVFLTSDAFRRVYEGTAKNVPVPLKSIGNRAVLEHGIPPSAKAKFVKAFSESAADAGLAEIQGESVVIRNAVGGRPVSTIQTPVEPITSDEAESSLRPAGEPIVINQAWAFRGGSAQLIIRSTAPLPASAYAEVAKVVGAAADLVSHLESVEPRADPAPRGGADAADEELG